jgi:uncharacterized membrane protein
MLAIGLALAASLTWGIADFLGGWKSRQLALLAVVATSQTVGLLIMGAVVLARGEPAPGAEYLVYAALAGICGPVGLAAFYRGMAIGSMSVIAPISATAAVVPLVFGIATGDRLGFVQGLGVALALAGVALASREEADEAAGSGRVATGVGLALISALGFGGFFVSMDAASEADPAWALFFQRVTSVSLFTAAVVAYRPSFSMTRPDLGALVAIGGLEMAANALYAAASTEGLVSIVSVLASLYPVMTIALAHVVLGERIYQTQWLGVATALTGVVLISAG